MKRSKLLFITVVLFFSCILILGPAYPADAGKSSTPEEEFVEVDEMPKMVYMEKVVYPVDAKKDGIEGSVMIKAFVDINGDVTEAKVVKSSGVQSMDNSALESAKRSKFEPGIKDDKPVAMWITYEIRFALDTKDAKK